MPRRSFLFALAAALGVALSVLVPAAAQSLVPAAGPVVRSDAPLRVGIVERPPFASKDESGSWQGLAVNLWRTGAEKMDADYAFVELSEGEIADAVSSGRVDVALPVYASEEQAAKADLVFPFYTATLGIAERRSSGVVKTATSLFSWQFLRIILYLSALLLVVGALIWLLERRGNEEQFARSPVRGLGDGFWWAGVTLTTIGYGDKAPATLPGRAVAMLWMLIGLAVSASLTAAVVSAAGTSSGPPDDVAAYIGDKSVGIVEGSTSAAYLRSSGVEPKGYANLSEGLNAVADGEIDLFAHAAPALLSAKEKESLNVRVTRTLADPIFVTMALPEGSALAEPLERYVIERTTSQAWWQHADRWIPERR
ncbi:ion channel [Parvularcula dongshanensis]|uniref:ABC-type amino acid transport substrate-binding protein n=1 Tax=Parvularcula dongshanensis TaxID=1173995 RepID=A0A840I438_9PROT|nr:transporter substrate-binding domain-containing protein [Parvularcula dongshanensis]MBB4658800.1 ABC-type amino acid transport substrate-binding protein [Parvularcula dongshanensis]